MPAPVLDLLGLGGLVVLLVVAFAHPRPSRELVCGVLVASVLLATGALPWSAARSTVDRLLPVVVFLSTSLVVAEVCAADGVFGHLGALVRRVGRASPLRMLRLTTVVAALVTVLLSLDATVVMLTPVVLASAGRERQGRPLSHVCVRMANSASLLLPVSNLTNLLVLPVSGLGFVRWAGVLALPWLAVVVVEYAGVRLFFRADLTRAATAHESRVGAEAQVLPPLPVFTFAVLAAMLGGFAVASAGGIHPFWVSAAAAAVLGARSLHRRTASPARLVASAHVSFAVFVLALGLAVAATGRTFLADLLTHALAALGWGADGPATGLHTAAGLVALLVLVALTTVLTNVVNNLPAILLLLPLVAPWGTLPLLVVLVGVNVGAGLSYPGSLANLLWRRVLVRAGSPPSARTFHLQAAVVVPVALLVSVTLLWTEGALGWIG